jgi:hypothetical protein
MSFHLWPPGCRSRAVPAWISSRQAETLEHGRLGSLSKGANLVRQWGRRQGTHRLGVMESPMRTISMCSDADIDSRGSGLFAKVGGGVERGDIHLQDRRGTHGLANG